MERREPDQERVTALEDRDLTGGHRAAVPDTFHDDVDGPSRNSGPDESGMQRMSGLALDGPPGADERLREELTAVDAVEHLDDAGRDAVVVHPDLFHLQTPEQVVERAEDRRVDIGVVADRHVGILHQMPTCDQRSA